MDVTLGCYNAAGCGISGEGLVVLELFERHLYYMDGASIEEFPRWGNFFVSLGIAITYARSNKSRTIVGIVVPTRAFAAPLICAGIIMEGAMVPFNDSRPSEHFRKLEGLKPGTPVTVLETSGKSKKKGILLGTFTRNGKQMIGVQVQSRNASGAGRLTFYLPLEQSLRIEVSAEELTSLSDKPKSIALPDSSVFLDSFLGVKNAGEFLRHSRLECLILGNMGFAREEIIGTTLCLSETGPPTGTLQDILRVRKFKGAAASFRSDIVAVSKDKPPHRRSEDVPSAVVFDGSTGFCRWRDLWPESDWVVVLDRSDSGYRDAATAINTLYEENSSSEYVDDELPSVPAGIELIAFREGLLETVDS